MVLPNIASVLRGARACGVVLAGTLAFATWASTPPSQSPLLSRVSDPPPPNVMITIDDSGSMQAHYMPEGSKVINGGTVDLPSIVGMSDMVDVFPSDPLHGSSGAPKGMSYGDPASTNAFMRWMRSPDTNSIFYNPAIMYLPWVKVTQTGSVYTVGRYPQADVTKAYWDPTDPSTTDTTKYTDLTKTNSGLSVKWCSTRTSCTSTAKVYHPMLYFLLKSGADASKDTSYTTIDLNTASGSATFPASTARQCTGYTNCCAAAGCTLSQERQNFANWFVYYRTRTHLMKGAMSEALNNVNGRIRVGLGTINSSSKTIDGVSTEVIKQGVRMMVKDDKLPADNNKTLYNILAASNGIQKLDPSGGTPLREATWTVGQYFRRPAGTADTGSPWNETPGSDATVLTCRRSYMLLTTDGYYNDDVSSYGSVGNVDGANGADFGDIKGGKNPLDLKPTQYLTKDGYPDKTSKRLADFAMYNYVNDLQTDVDNRVPHSGDDIAFWQHLNMFTVGLGVEGNIDPDTVATLKGDNTKWPDTGLNAEKIDDLLHAAVNTHGAFFSAKDSTSLSDALSAALGSAASANRSESGVATTTVKVNAGTMEFIPSYQSVMWTGDVAANAFPSGTPVWKASTSMPAWDSRKVWTWSGSASVAFNPQMSSTLLNLVTSKTADQANIVNYIRGDKSNEGAGKPYRIRSSILGDFVDSTPVFVQNWTDLAYDTLPNSPGYRDWINNTLGKRSFGVLFQGANDGMLHAFTTAPTTNAPKGGEEVYAYVPYGVLGKLTTLTDTTYGSTSNFHQDYVDGAQIETHAFIKTKANTKAHWSDLVVGSYGAGAKGLYAIDATDLSNLNSANTLLWETGSDPDLGYVMSEVAVGMTPDGKWKAFVGNGPGSTSGHSVLMILDLETGAILDRVTVDSSSTDSGLMGVQLIYDANKQAMAAYAGDLKGNLWRIELSGTTPVIGFGNKPLFKAVNANGDAQPISVQPTVIPHSGGGWLVLFGTGKLIVDSDQDDKSTQSFYAVRDKTAADSSAEGATSPYEADITAGTPRKSLVQQTITADAKPGLFDVSQEAVDYAKNNGWYMDLSPVKATQRIEFPAVMLNQFVLINTISPADKPTGPCDTSSGNSAYFLLPAFTGAQYTAPVWDTNNDGVVDSSDSTAAGYQSGDEGGKTTVVYTTDKNGDSVCENLNATGGGKLCKIPHGIISRFVKQIMTPPF